MEEQVRSGVEEKNTAQRALDRDQAKDEACARRVQSFQNSSPYVGNKAANFIESDLEATTFPRAEYGCREETSALVSSQNSPRSITTSRLGDDRYRVTEQGLGFIVVKPDLLIAR